MERQKDEGRATIIALRLRRLRRNIQKKDYYKYTSSVLLCQLSKIDKGITLSMYGKLGKGYYIKRKEPTEKKFFLFYHNTRIISHVILSCSNLSCLAPTHSKTRQAMVRACKQARLYGTRTRKNARTRRRRHTCLHARNQHSIL